MAGPAAIGNDRLGPVAEVSTQERCNALYPGSSPGRVSSLRCSAASARQASGGEGCRAVARRAKAGRRPPPGLVQLGPKHQICLEMAVDEAAKTLLPPWNLV